MNALRRLGCALGFCAALLTISGCGESQPSSIVPEVFAQNRFLTRDADERSSWMSPGAARKDLLYVAGSRYDNHVYIFTYPAGQHVGTLKVFLPGVLCIDASQNIWASSGYTGYNEMLEYAHGRSKPHATLANDYGTPLACSVDPKTGDLAVANIEGNVVIYANAQGNPTVYSLPFFPTVWGCAYDTSGNLFASGLPKGSGTASGTQLAELPAGASQFEELAPLKDLCEGCLAGLQWDGTYLDLADGRRIAQVIVTGSETIKDYVRLQQINVATAGNFFVDGSTIITYVDSKLGPVGLWNFPSGGYPIDIIPRARGERRDSLFGIAVSKAINR